jgi:hypothetical protein
MEIPAGKESNYLIAGDMGQPKIGSWDREQGGKSADGKNRGSPLVAGNVKRGSGEPGGGAAEGKSRDSLAGAGGYWEAVGAGGRDAGANGEGSSEYPGVIHPRTRSNYF